MASNYQEGPDTSAPNGIPALQNSLRVLVVDDYRDAAETFGQVLELLGHDIRVCYGGQQALAEAMGLRPHVVFLDLGMPGLDGFAVARQLRAQPDLASVVLVALTGFADGSHRARAREHFDHYLVKPCDPAEVLKILEPLVPSRRVIAAGPDALVHSDRS
jgi:CheY-like chemotaxis protein